MNTSSDTVSDPLLERLERLAARQSRTPSSRRPEPAPTDRHKRRHPARRARIGALVASCATTGGLTYLFAGDSTSQAGAAIPGLVAPIRTTASTLPSSTTAASGTSAASTTTTAAATSALPTTSVAATTVISAFDGDTVSTRYGPLQVQAQVESGRLVAVAVIQYPDGDGKSVRINQRSLPTLQSEALTAQSADVDTVSGATYTSHAYAQSLQAAIDAAQAAGAMTA